MTLKTLRPVGPNDKALRNFSSGDEDIDKKLGQQLKFVTINIVHLHGLYVNKILVGIVTLEAGVLQAPQDVIFNFSGTNKPVPTLHIEVLAIRNTKRRKGFGRILIEYAIAVGVEMSSKVGLKTLSLEATPDSVSFYQDVGFDQADSTWGDGSLPMWFVLK